MRSSLVPKSVTALRCLLFMIVSQQFPSSANFEMQFRPVSLSFFSFEVHMLLVLQQNYPPLAEKVKDESM